MCVGYGVGGIETIEKKQQKVGGGGGKEDDPREGQFQALTINSDLY